MKALDYNGADHFVDKIYDLVNSGGSADYIVEEGTSGIWTYRKWASGVAECWGKVTVTLSGTGTLWKTPLYAYVGISAQNYPFEFYEVPTETVSVSQAQNATWLYKQAYAEMNNTKTKTAAYALIKVDAFDNGSTAVLSYHVKGLWKEFTPSAVSSNYQLQADYVVEYQNNQSDGYTKWASGKLECWKRVSTSVDITTSWSSFYYGSISSISYPVTFLYNPTVNITAQVKNGGGWLAPNYNDYSTSETGTLYFYRPTSQGNTSVTINIHAVGRWK